jgi:predicted acyltransferase
MSAAEQPRGSGQGQRLMSIDALRGFDMFWIVGGEDVVERLLKWAKPAYYKEILEQLDHVKWVGFHFEDLIFPMFLFLVGVVLPFSLAKTATSGTDRRAAYMRILRRTLLLYVLGLIYYGQGGVLDFYFAQQRYLGVLQRIAICYGIAAVITLNTRVLGQLTVLIAILVGYWLILTQVPVPGGVAGDLSPQGNLSGYIDRHYLPGRLWTEFYDNEGLLSTLPAVATALLGVLAGQWLRSGYKWQAKAGGLALAGVACLLIGMAWGEWIPAIAFPVIKNLWTSTFVLVAGGWSLILLAIFYAVIDGMNWRSWAFFFVVIGANAITIYLGHDLIDFEHTARLLFGGLGRWSEAKGVDRGLVLAVGVLTIEWLALYVLYRNRIFLRV